jgi:tRNA G18 (ribose-2'-O)-methylase SpoU
MQSNDSLWDDSRMDKPVRIIKYNVHTPFQGLGVEKVKTLTEGLALPFAFMAYNLHGDVNIGMMIRTAVILGASDFFLVGKRKYDRRTDVGSRNYIRLHRVPEVNKAFFDEQKLLPIALEQGGESLEEFSFKKYLPTTLPDGWKVCFIAGSESYGIPKSFLNEIGAPILTIAQYGVIRSLNVSIASGILMYEYMKQWRASVKRRL